MDGPPLSPPIDLSGPLDPALARRLLEDDALRCLAPYAFLQAERREAAPGDDTFRALRRIHALNQILCRIRHRELRRRLEAFAAESIPAIPLKGTHLAARLYGDVGGRALGVDIDLLVRRDDAARAATVLERDGYRAAGPPDRYDRPFCRVEDDSSKTTVELHAEPLPRWFLAPDLADALWSRARPPDADALPAWTLDRDDELLYLCAHLIKDQVETRPGADHLRHALDLHLAIEHWGETIDWLAFVGRARALGLNAHAALALGFVAHWLGTAVPDAVVNELPPWRRGVFERLVWGLGGDAARRRLPLGKELRLLGLVLLLDRGWRARAGHLGWAWAEVRARWGRE